MKQPTPRPHTHRATLVVVLLASFLATSLLPGPSVRAADDIDLLREPGATPYVMIVLDTSGSMALGLPTTNKKDDFGDWVPAGADDPSSKLFQVKKALYEVISGVENVHFGFATFNQDHLQVTGKHWLYRPTESASFDGGKLNYPEAVAAQDQAAHDTSWVFGPMLNGTGILGSCGSPLDLTMDRRKLDRFARLGVAGNQETYLWIAGTNHTYLMKVEPSGADVTYGDPQIAVTLTVYQFQKNTCSFISGSKEVKTVRFALETPFLMVEGDVGQTGVPYSIPASQDSQCASNETLAGYFAYQDVIANGTCGSGSSSPFTGDGWDGNGDSGARTGDPNLDPYCVSGDCLNLRFPTTLISPLGRELDLGDIVPWSWDNEYKDNVLKRLNPRYPEQPPEAPAVDPNTGKVDPAEQAAYEKELTKYFGVASFLADTPSSSPSGAIALKAPTQRPLLAYGNSPLARAVNDVRCWYLGGENDNKCKSSHDEGGSEFKNGWKKLFQDADLYAGCQDRHLILITDGEDNAKGQDAAAETTELNKADARFKTTVFSFQDSQVFQRFKSNSDADVILVDDGEDLKTKLEEIIGSIKQDSRTFATAAVPSVQSTTDQNIYITNFEPRNEFGVWEGHLQAFNRNFETLATTDPAFLWDSGVTMLDQSPDPVSGSAAGTDLQLDTGSGTENARRPLYVEERIPDITTRAQWAMNRKLFDRTNGGADDRTSTTTTPATPQGSEADFWQGLQLSYDPADPDSVRSTRIRANRIVESTLIEKTRINDDGSTQNYILGDIFHFDPLLVAGPRNTRYFAEDAEETYDTDGSQKGTGYQEFFNRQENRRRVLFAGANDGMLHAFDAGRAFIKTLPREDPNPARKVVRYGDDKGKEIFSYIPRAVLPTVRDLAESPVSHRWGVDAPAAAGDVFVDPLNDGTPTTADREWRTVLIGGLREGGAGYYALDITHPDPIEKVTIGPTGTDVDPSELRDVYVPKTPSAVVPGCYNSTSSECDAVKYPAPLWEFYDRVWNPVSRSYLPLDEDSNGYPDLGETWSKATIGRIKVEDTDGNVVNKYVAVVGGGLDPVKADRQGDWLYMIDIETGTAIYKRQVEGSVAADTAAVDTDADGFLDRIYAGTTAGFLYRVDLVGTDSSTGDPQYPKLVDVSKVNALAPDGTTIPIQVKDPIHWQRIEARDSSGDPVWQPKKIFTTDGRPIFFRPSVIFVANLDRYALAFGTGDREDLTSYVDQMGRFYVFVDDSAAPLIEPLLPLDETAFTEILADSGDHTDLLTDPSLPEGTRGWYLVLQPNERVIGNPFAFSGITFFATFEPKPPTDAETCTATNSSKDCTPTCQLTGTSRVYLVGTTDADAFLQDPNDATLLKRYHKIDGFVTNPFTEQAVTTTSGSNDNKDDNTADRDKLTAAEEKLLEKLQSLFPPNCKFGNHRIDVNVIESESVSLKRVATVPICIIEKNWKEF